MNNLREHSIPILIRGKRGHGLEGSTGVMNESLELPGERQHITPGRLSDEWCGDCRKVEWPPRVLMEGDTPGKGHVTSSLPWSRSCRHWSQVVQMRREDTQAHTHGSNPRWTLRSPDSSWVWYDENHPKSASLSIILVAQSHMIWSRTNQREQLATLREQDQPQGPRTTPQAWVQGCTRSIPCVLWPWLNPGLRELQIFDEGILKFGALWGLGPRQLP